MEMESHKESDDITPETLNASLEVEEDKYCIVQRNEEHNNEDDL